MKLNHVCQHLPNTYAFPPVGSNADSTYFPNTTLHKPIPTETLNPLLNTQAESSEAIALCPVSNIDNIFAVPLAPCPSLSPCVRSRACTGSNRATDVDTRSSADVSSSSSGPLPGEVNEHPPLELHRNHVIRHPPPIGYVGVPGKPGAEGGRGLGMDAWGSDWHPTTWEGLVRRHPRSPRPERVITRLNPS